MCTIQYQTQHQTQHTPQERREREREREQIETKKRFTQQQGMDGAATARAIRKQGKQKTFLFSFFFFFFISHIFSSFFLFLSLFLSFFLITKGYTVTICRISADAEGEWGEDEEV